MRISADVVTEDDRFSILSEDPTDLALIAALLAAVPTAGVDDRFDFVTAGGVRVYGRYGALRDVDMQVLPRVADRVHGRES